MVVRAIIDMVSSGDVINEKIREIGGNEVEKVENKELTPPCTPRTSGSGDSEFYNAPLQPEEYNDETDKAVPDSKEQSKDIEDEASDTDEIANSLFREEFVLIQPEEYTQFLASNDNENSKVRSKYMDLFQWKSNILESTRMLCAKLYLKGESQEIDRILTAFTKSYLKQHPSNVFCTKDFEKMYIIIYSLILLNTALHNSEVDKRSKISKAEYVRNTFTTFVRQSSKTSKTLSIRQRILIERELSKFYEDLASEKLHLKQLDSVISTKKPYNSKNTAESNEFSPSKNASVENGEPLTRQISQSSIWSTDTSYRRSSLAVNRVTSTTSKTYDSKNQSARGFARALLTEQNQKYYNPRLTTSPVKNQGLAHLRGAPSTAVSNSQVVNKRASRASIISKESGYSFAGDEASMLSFDIANLNSFDNAEESVGYQNLENFKVDDYQDSYDLTLELSGSPYLKEGLLKVKILNNDEQENGVAVESNASSSSSSFISSNSSVSTASKILSFFRSSNSEQSSSYNSKSSNKNPFLQNKFVENFVVVSKGELSIYSFDPKIIKKQRERKKKLNNKNFSKLDLLEEEEDVDNVGDGNWLKNAANIGNYNLCSTFAQLEKQTGYSNKKTISWSLTFSKISRREPMKILFEAGTKEIALEFINTCNFWASKITAIPTLEEIVSSIEYGWNDLDGLIKMKDQLKKFKNIQKWEPLPKGVYLSAYVVNDERGDGYHEGMMKQFIKTLKYYNHLKNLYQEFSNMRVKFLKVFSLKSHNSSNYSRILNNYDNKIAEYKSELTKYKDYLVILAYGLQLRFDLETKDREEDDTLKESQDGTVDEDDELTKLVKSEIVRLLADIKNLNNVIPTFYSNKDVSTKDDQLSLTQTSSEAAFPLVKSPKTFTLSNFKDKEAPVQQILQEQSSNVEMGQSYSTNTIREEEEPEEEEVALKA